MRSKEEEILFLQQLLFDDEQPKFNWEFLMHRLNIHRYEILTGEEFKGPSYMVFNIPPDISHFARKVIEMNVPCWIDHFRIEDLPWWRCRFNRRKFVEKF